MEVDMDSSSPRTSYDPEDNTIREQFRRYGKRLLTSDLSPHHESFLSKTRQGRLLYDGSSIHSPTNAALVLEDIKQEAAHFDVDYLDQTPVKSQSSSKRRYSIDSHGILESNAESIRRGGSYLLKACKQEDESILEHGESTFSLFASLVESALQGLMSIPDLILRFEAACRDFSESIRYGSSVRHHLVEDKLMRQKAQFLLDEAASWSLLWYLYGKGNESLTFANSCMLMFSLPTNT